MNTQIVDGTKLPGINANDFMRGKSQLVLKAGYIVNINFDGQNIFVYCKEKNELIKLSLRLEYAKKLEQFTGIEKHKYLAHLLNSERAENIFNGFPPLTMKDINKLKFDFKQFDVKIAELLQQKDELIKQKQTEQNKLEQLEENLRTLIKTGEKRKEMHKKIEETTKTEYFY